MKKLQLILATTAVSIGVALTYHYFELVVRNSIDRVWDTVFDTSANRWLVVPLCLVLTLVFFGVQHRLDPASEKKQSEGLGDMPKPSLQNYGKVLLIGFLSLIAGASLGPEAILVPSCMMIGGLVGVTFFKKDPRLVKLLAMIGFISLMAAFFNSFIAGIVGLLLVTKQMKLKLSPPIVLLATLASFSTVVVLSFLPAKPYVQLPNYTWAVSSSTIVTVILLVLMGGALTYGMKGFLTIFKKLQVAIAEQAWWFKATVAAIGLSLLYLAGGSLVMFTGNDAIVPMLEKAPTLGYVGLAWILVVKLAAISWSKAMGYRGGMIFPTVFAASICVALSQLVVADVNFIYGLIAVMVGALVADSKAKVLL